MAKKIVKKASTPSRRTPKSGKLPGFGTAPYEPSFARPINPTPYVPSEGYFKVPTPPLPLEGQGLAGAIHNPAAIRTPGGSPLTNPMDIMNPVPDINTPERMPTPAEIRAANVEPMMPEETPKLSTPKPAGRFGKFKNIVGKLDKPFGRLMGAATAASVGIPLWEAMFADAEPSALGKTPADTGAMAADWIKNKLGSQQRRADIQQGKPVKRIGATGSWEPDELPPMNSIASHGDGGGGGIPPNSEPPELSPLAPDFTEGEIRKASRSGRSRFKAPIKGRALPSNMDTGLQIKPVPELPELPVLESRDLPEKGITLGQRSLNTALGNDDSRNPDMQQSGGEAVFNTYADHIRNMPERSDYKPSVMRRIVGALAGFGQGWQGGPMAGYGASRNIVDEPFNQAMGEWKAKADELQPLAELEGRNVRQQEELGYKRERDQLIHEVRTIENEIRALATAGKITNDAERTKILRMIAEAKQDFQNNQVELGRQKLDEIREYHKGLLGLGQQRIGIQSADVASKITDRTADNTRADEKAAKGGNTNFSLKANRAEQAAMRAVMRKLGSGSYQYVYADQEPEDAVNNPEHPYHQARKLFRDYLTMFLQNEGLDPNAVPGAGGDIKLR